MGVKIRPFAMVGDSGGNPVQAQGVFFSGSEGTALVNQTISPTGGTGVYSFVGVGLPTGVTIGASTGVISGTPTQSGNILATINITDSAGSTASTIAAFSILQTSFSDTFNRASGAVGTNWAMAVMLTTPVVPPTSAHEGIVTTSTVDGLQCLAVQFLGTANPNTRWPLRMIPLPVVEGLLANTVSQFAQITFIVQAAQASGGVTVFGRTDELTYYQLVNNTPTNSVLLIRANQGTGTTLATIQAAALAQNDVIRLAAEVQVGQVQITCSINGAPTVVNDNSASRITSGVPGIIGRGYNQTGTGEWRNFSCGAGL
jgi:hypothetical protein